MSQPRAAVLVIGAGVAGCAAAVAAAQAGARVALREAGHHLGGVAARGEHRTLCGLAAIDAPRPELLEPELVGAWIARLATGDPYRAGRVWLWPTVSERLQLGLAEGLRAHGVAPRCGSTLVAVESSGARVIAARFADGERLAIDGLIDASGRAASCALQGGTHQGQPRPGPAGSVARPAGAMRQAEPRPSSAESDASSDRRQWGAWRGVLRCAIGEGRAARVRALARVRAALAEASAFATAASRPAWGEGDGDGGPATARAEPVDGSAGPALALTPLDGDRWQLSLDLPPGSVAALGAAWAERAARALGGELLACARAVAERDEGRPRGGLTLAELFASRERGLCWAAWPREWHGADGVEWTWPDASRHGVPLAAARASGGAANHWLVGKAMAVDADAAAALRVTGTALAVGAAVGALAARG